MLLPLLLLPSRVAAARAALLAAMSYPAGPSTQGTLLLHSVFPPFETVLASHPVQAPPAGSGGSAGYFWCALFLSFFLLSFVFLTGAHSRLQPSQTTEALWGACAACLSLSGPLLLRPQNTIRTRECRRCCRCWCRRCRCCCRCPCSAAPATTHPVNLAVRPVIAASPVTLPALQGGGPLVLLHPRPRASSSFLSFFPSFPSPQGGGPLVLLTLRPVRPVSKTFALCLKCCVTLLLPRTLLLLLCACGGSPPLTLRMPAAAAAPCICHVHGLAQPPLPPNADASACRPIPHLMFGPSATTAPAT